LIFSRFFIGFPISGLGEPEIYQNLVCFTTCGGFTWRLCDLWRIKWGVTYRGLWGCR